MEFIFKQKIQTTVSWKDCSHFFLTLFYLYAFHDILNSNHFFSQDQRLSILSLHKSDTILYTYVKSVIEPKRMSLEHSVLL